MPVRLTLRSNKDFSPFREMLKWLIEAPVGDSMLLCSGYIWEPRWGYRVLDDELLVSIKKGCTSGKIVTVAGKLENEMWRDFYGNFVHRLRSSGVSLESYVAPEHNWHAKIAMRLKEDVPVAAIVGSSNLTGPAYRLDPENWNFEGDVLIWKPDPALDTYFRRPFRTQSQLGDIHLILDPSVRQPDEEAQMIALFKDVMHSELSEFNE
jgi:hypothetical protein